MLDVARDFFAGILDRLREGKAIGQAGEAVAEHFGAKRPLRLQLDRAVDDAEKAPALRTFRLQQRRKLDPIELRRNAIAVGEIEFAGNIAPVEEFAQKIGDWTVFEAVRLVPVQSGAV